MSNNTLRVLLLLDVQVAVLADPPAGVPSSISIRRNIEQILNSARNAHPPPMIIHVRNTGDAGDSDEPNTPGWELLYAPLPQEYVIDKLKNNAFTGTELGDLIHPHAEIVIIGLLSDFALKSTCTAAVARGNEVLLIRGAHGTYDRLEVLYGGGITPAAAIETAVEVELEDAGAHILDMKDLQGIFNNR
ncbi:Isochorismatase-like protein [Desarmillaria ectypa]|nr:Isochorismatase-like protein [Desarmillaria ectypa]